MSNPKLKTKILEFIQNTDIRGHPAQNSTSPGHWPDTLFNIFAECADSFARIRSSYLGITQTILTLQEHLTEGNIPAHLELKFKKLFTNENEVETRALMITATINQEKTALTGKSIELDALYQNRFIFVTNKFAPYIEFGVVVDPLYLTSVLDYLIREKLIQFHHKKLKDEEAKTKKKEAFLRKKDAENEPVAFNKKQLGKMENAMKALQSQVAALKLKKSPGKVNGAKPKVQSSSPKTKGKRNNEERDNGKKQNTANTKRSRGKNGK
jgi:hypothetical protein